MPLLNGLSPNFTMIGDGAINLFIIMENNFFIFFPLKNIIINSSCDQPKYIRLKLCHISNKIEAFFMSGKDYKSMGPMTDKTYNFFFCNILS